MDKTDTHVLVRNPEGNSSVVLVCEHASHHIPKQYDALGLSAEDRLSHAAWDPGAMAVAEHMSRILDAVLVANGVSRLVYDCNRPPTAPDAMPSRSEVIEISGNADLSEKERAARIEAYYLPFFRRLADTIQTVEAPVLVTIHSFTPVYHGKPRAVEIGILHDTDTRLADAMLDTAAAHLDLDVQRNAPYGAADGVTHTLQTHAIQHGHLNVMLEIRNDLIETADQQEKMAEAVSQWVVDACTRLNAAGVAQCRV